MNLLPLLLGVLVAATASAEPVLPSQVLDLSNWKLDYPQLQRKPSVDVKQPRLAGFSDPDLFCVTNGGVRFSAPCGAGTTKTSPYPRSELREMLPGGTNKAAWSTARGLHEMTIREAITVLPVKKPHVVAGQIHGIDDDVTVLRLEGRKLYITDGDNSHGHLLDADYPLGRIFTFTIHVRDGIIAYEYDGMPVPFTLKKREDGCYFKVGCYTQSNVDRGDAPEARGEVIVYAVTVRHDPPL